MARAGSAIQASSVRSLAPAHPRLCPRQHASGKTEGREAATPLEKRCSAVDLSLAEPEPSWRDAALQAPPYSLPWAAGRETGDPLQTAYQEPPLQKELRGMVVMTPPSFRILARLNPGW